MQRLEYENGQLKGNMLANWKPMKLPENWTDVVAHSRLHTRYMRK